MNLNASTHVALSVLIACARSTERLLPCNKIAEIVGVPRHALGRITQQLSHAGFLIGFRGRPGGIMLAHNPEEIRIGDVIRAMEQSRLKQLAEIRQPSMPEDQRLTAMLETAEEAFFITLNRRSVADIANSRSRAPARPSA